MATIPSETYIPGVILTSLVTLLTQKMYTEVDEDDAARALLIKIGPRQQDPVAVGLFLYENDYESPDEWAHGQDVMISRGGSSRLTGVEMARLQRLPVGRQTIGSEPEWLNQRCFTMLQEVWLEKVPGVVRTEENLALLSQVVAGRVRRHLKDAGPHFGAGQNPTDTHGEQVFDGPFFGTEYAVRQVGKALFVARYLRFWYRTSEH